MDRMMLLVLLALAAAVVATGVGIACLVRIDQIGAAMGLRAGGRGRSSRRLAGRGKLVHWPHQPPHR